MDEMLAQVRMFAGNYAPQNWAFCYGQSLPISQYNALFSLLGTSFGGDGRTTFNLPDYRGIFPMGTGNATRYPADIRVGQTGGTSELHITTANLPSHSHTLIATNSNGNTSEPQNAILANTQGFDKEYNNAPTSHVSMSPTAIGNTGGSIPIQSLPPFTAISFIICVNGYYPPRS